MHRNGLVEFCAVSLNFSVFVEMKALISEGTERVDA